MGILIVSLFIVAIFITSNNVFISKMALNNKNKLMEETDRQIISIYSKYIGALDIAAESIARSDMLKQYVNNYYYYEEVSNDNSDMFFYLNVIGQSNEYIDNIMVYDYSREYLITNKDDYASYYDMTKLPWFLKDASNLKTLEELNKYCTWNMYNDYIAVTYRADLINPTLTKPIFITLNIHKVEFAKLLNMLTITENANNAFIVKEDLMFYLEGPETMSSYLKSDIFKKYAKVSLGERTRFNYEYSWYYMQYRPLNTNYESGLLYVIPEMDMSSGTYKYSIIISLVGSLLMLIIAYVAFRHIINSNIQKPISQLIKGMEKVGNGDFTYKLDDEICKDGEIKGLFCAYNSMTDRVTVLIEELYQAELYRKQLELQALQDKIDPHFLYNTLDTINWTAKEHNVDEISKIVVSLSTMYRKIFNKGKDLTTVKDALEGIECYLAIQRIRYGESFSYQIFCPESLEQCVILNLIIQTIVENAIIHGLEDQSFGRLEIHVEREKDDIIIKVADNGIGMTEGKLNLINTSINSLKLESESGLRNVQKRIKLYYGMQYGIIIDSKYKIGTTVTIRVPYREREKDD